MYFKVRNFIARCLASIFLLILSPYVLSANCPSPFEPSVTSSGGVTRTNYYEPGARVCVETASNYCPECKPGFFHVCQTSGKWDPMVNDACVQGAGGEDVLPPIGNTDQPPRQIGGAGNTTHSGSSADTGMRNKQNSKEIFCIGVPYYLYADTSDRNINYETGEGLDVVWKNTHTDSRLQKWTVTEYKSFDEYINLEKATLREILTEAKAKHPRANMPASIPPDPVAMRLSCEGAENNRELWEWSFAYGRKPTKPRDGN